MLLIDQGGLPLLINYATGFLFSGRMLPLALSARVSLLGAGAAGTVGRAGGLAATGLGAGLLFALHLIGKVVDLKIAYSAFD